MNGKGRRSAIKGAARPDPPLPPSPGPSLEDSWLARGGQRQRSRDSDVLGGGGSSGGRERERGIREDGTLEEDEEGRKEGRGQEKSGTAAGRKGEREREKHRQKWSKEGRGGGKEKEMERKRKKLSAVGYKLWGNAGW